MIHEFNTKDGVYLKSDNSTMKMMYHVIIVLIPFVLYNFYINGISPFISGNSLLTLFYPIIMVVVSIITCLLTEYLYYLIKKEKKSFLYLIENSFSIIPGIFISLIVPVTTPIWLIIVGCVVASLSKMLSGGLSKNKLNPALLGALVILLISRFAFNDYITGLTNQTLNYDLLVGTNMNLGNYLLGNILNPVGSSCIILVILAFFYLVINNVIKYRIPLISILTVIMISFIVMLIRGVGIWYMLYHLVSGSFLFMVVLMATDPVTSPLNKYGEVYAGILIGFITMLFRLLTPFSYSSLITILIVNLLTILINKITIKFYYKKSILKVITIVLLLVVAITSVIVAPKNKEINRDDEVVYADY